MPLDNITIFFFINEYVILMTRAASLCGGEYLNGYSKRARNLTVKLKAHKE